jgi:flagellar biosynthesis protein FliR
MEATTRAAVVRTVVVFLGLVIGFVVAVLIAQNYARDLFEQMLALSIGSALLGGGLAFFLIEIFHLERTKGARGEASVKELSHR